MQITTNPRPIPVSIPKREGASVQNHWPEYFMEAGCLALFMMAACIFGVLLEHPASPIHQAIDSTLARRALMGTAMGVTAICIFCSPWGQRSGAHINPAVTFSYFLLGKIEKRDAILYVLAQFVGGIAGVWVAEMLIGLPLRHSAVNYVVTTPGHFGWTAAFVAEALISFAMMTMVLAVSNSKRLHPWTPIFAGCLVAIYITAEAPISGMSMNPARTFGSAFAAQDWTALWIYFTAPVLGMLVAGQVYQIRNGRHSVLCAKLHHDNDRRCIFRCNYAALKT